MTFDLLKCWQIFQENIVMFMSGVQVTLIYAIIGTVAGFIIGLILGGIRALEINDSDSAAVKVLKRIGRLFTSLYIWVFRGTPMMVQAMFLYYGLPYFTNAAMKFTNVWGAALLVVSINTGAYMAEIIRSGLQSVDSGQSEAAKSLGMSTLQTMVHIIFPQAIRNAFPSIGNQLIVNIKDSSMLSVIWVLDLFFQSQSLAGSNYRPVETYFVATVLYLILTTIATLLLNFVEKRMNMKSETRDLCA